MRFLAVIKALAIATLLAATLPQASAIAAESDASDRVVVTDTRGRPPFKRARVASAAEFSRFEESDTAASRRAIHKGRPPFARHVADNAESSTAEFSRFEEAADRRPTRRGPPGKLTSRR